MKENTGIKKAFEDLKASAANLAASFKLHKAQRDFVKSLTPDVATARFNRDFDAMLQIPLQEAPPTPSTMKPSNPKDVVGASKPPQAVVSQLVMMELGVAMLEGTCKYGRHNYREAGVRASIYYDATRRHLDYWWEGEDIDPDSGLSHITKAIASLTVLRDAMLMEKFTDDRPPKMPKFAEFKSKLELMAKGIIERYAGRDVKHVTHLNLAITPESGVKDETHSV